MPARPALRFDRVRKEGDFLLSLAKDEDTKRLYAVFRNESFDLWSFACYNWDMSFYGDRIIFVSEALQPNIGAAKKMCCTLHLNPELFSKYAQKWQNSGFPRGPIITEVSASLSL